jgi:N-methylhydantoinase A
MGLLSQDLAQSAAATLVHRLDVDGLELVRQLWPQLVSGLRNRSDLAVAEQDGHNQLDGLEASDEAALDLRYVGQEYSLTIPLAPDDLSDVSDSAVEQVLRQFSSVYERTFGHVLPHAVEIVTVRATRRRRLPPMQVAPDMFVSANGAGRQSDMTSKTYSLATGTWTSFALLERASIRPGEVVQAPSIVVESTATTYLDLGYEGRALEDGSLLISREEARTA